MSGRAGKYMIAKLALTPKQLGQLKNAMENGTPCTLALAADQLQDEVDAILVTPAQNGRILAAKAAGSPVKLRISSACVAAMREQVGSGILDSLGSLFNSVKTTAIGAANSVKNAASSAWRNVRAAANRPPAPPAPQVQRGRNWTITTKPGAVEVPDRGQQFDHMPPSWKQAPPKSGFAQIAKKVNDFDAGVHGFFNYPRNVGTWGEQVYKYEPGRREDF